MEPSTQKNLEVESCNESEDCKKDVDNQMVPAYMGAFMRRQFLQGMVKSFPAALQNRIVVLKNIQLEHLKLEAQFFEEVYKLEKIYHDKFQPLFDRRKDIISGIEDPEQEDPKWKDDDENPSDKSPEFSQMMKNFKQIPENVKGIPDFWLTIFRNTEILSEMVQEHDEPVLKKLQDIKIQYDDEHSYTLQFYFNENEYFSNSLLTKKYFLKSTVDEDYPFAFEGPEIYKCTGCTINWGKKMNLTVKTIRKKQKHKERGQVRTIIKQIPNDSFFNFFNPPEMPEDKEEVDEESQGILATDFEIGHFLRSRIIPKAVLYFTGDVIDDEDDDDDEYDAEDEDECDESGDENTQNQKKLMIKQNSPNECQNQ